MAGDELRYAYEGSIQKTSYLQHRYRVHSAGRIRDRAGYRYTYNIDQGRIEGPGLSLNGDPGPMGRGWRAQMRVVGDINAYRHTQVLTESITE